MTQTVQYYAGDYHQSPVLRHRAWSCDYPISWKQAMVLERAKVRHKAPKSWAIVHIFSG